MRTHPLTEDRIETLKAIQYENGWDDSAAVTPLLGFGAE